MFSTELILAGSIAVVVAGISKGGFGGGLGVIAVPLIALVESPVTAAAIMLPILCFMDLVGLWFYRGQWSVELLLILVPAAIVGIVAGSLGFRHFDPAAIKLAIGVIAVGFALFYWFGDRWRRAPDGPLPASRAKGIFWGGVAGFTSFVAHAGGPPTMIYLLPLKLHKTIYQGTTVVFFIAVNYIKLIPYYWLGLLHPGNLEVSLAFFPLAFAAMLLGVYLHRRVSDRLFYRVCYAVLAIVGVRLILEG